MLEFLFSFLLNYTPALSVLIFAAIILFVINIFYKILINQEQARQIKQRSRELNREMKEAQKAGEKEKSKKLMSEMLAENSKMMRMTMKPMLVSLIIVVILLPSLASLYGDRLVSIENGKGSVALGGTDYQIGKTGNALRVGDTGCEMPCTAKIGRFDYKITQEGSSAKFAQIVAVLPIALPMLGNSFGWLGWYVIVSIPLAILLRKAMKIYM